MFSIEPVKRFLDRARRRLDEELDVQSNYWSNAELLEYANEGLREVWQAVRETHQNWFVRELTSTDPIRKIGGRDYNPNELQLVTRRNRLKLPSDFRELLFIEGLAPALVDEIPDQFFPQIRFEYANLTQRKFRSDVLNTVVSNTRVYQYDVIFNATEGPYLLLSPPLALNQNIECRIQYLAAPAQLLLNDTFEGTGYTLEMTDAILAYILWAAAGKEKLIENLSTFKAIWDLKRELAVRSAGPKQTRDEETVEGYMEDEDY